MITDFESVFAAMADRAKPRVEVLEAQPVPRPKRPAPARREPRKRGPRDPQVCLQVLPYLERWTTALAVSDIINETRCCTLERLKILERRGLAERRDQHIPGKWGRQSIEWRCK